MSWEICIIGKTHTINIYCFEAIVMYWFPLHFSRQRIDIYAQVNTFSMGSVTLKNWRGSNYWTVLNIYLRNYDSNRKIIVGEIKTAKKINKNLYFVANAIEFPG